MKNCTLRTRLMLWSALFSAVTVALLGFLTNSLVWRHQVESLDRQLRDEARSVLHELAEHGAAGASHGALIVDKNTLAWVQAADGETVWISPKLKGENLAEAPAGAATLGKWRVVTMRENGFTVRTARDFQDVEATVADVRRAYAMTLPVLLGCVAAGAWWLVNSALKPVEAIGRAARRITAEHLDERLPIPARQDELGQLSGVLNEMLERLDRSFRQAARFTADASHEIRTPLSLMELGLEELLRRRDLPPDVSASLASLLDDNRRLAAVCRDLLVLAGADAGRLALNREPHDLNALIRAAVDDAEILGESRGLRFEVELPDEARAAVDGRYFTRILLNLLTNAVKYNRDGGTVRVRLAPEKGSWVLRIQNTGEPIAPEHCASLFRRFFRADGGADTTGHGLGLSLSRELARAHGGDVTLESSNAEWTTFQLTLPKTAPGSQGERIPEHSSAGDTTAAAAALPRSRGGGC